MSSKRIGFVGVGTMGGGMAANLVDAGFQVMVYDKSAEAVESLTNKGASQGHSVRETIEFADIVMTSLPFPEIWLQVATHEIVPAVRKDQIMLDMGTSRVGDVRAVAAKLSERGATLLDCPVTGGPDGAREGQLRIFVGGPTAAFSKSRDVLQVISQEDGVVHCGERVGDGLLMKSVNQLMMSLAVAGYIEAAWFGTRAGLDIEVIRRAIGNNGRFREDFDAIASVLQEGKHHTLDMKLYQTGDFLEDAAEFGFELPLTRTLHTYCEGGEPVYHKRGRVYPSYWGELARKHNTGASG